MKKALFAALLLCSITAFSQSRLYPYSDGSKWGITNEKVEVLIAPAYDVSFRFNDMGLSVVRKDAKAGVIDLKGKTIIPFTYEGLDIDRKFAYGRLIRKTTIVSLKTGKPVMPETFDRVVDRCNCADNLLV